MMIDYDRKQPLFFLHIPKTGGQTARYFFHDWYQQGFLSHYFNEQDAKSPQRYDIFNLHSTKKPIVVYGHFNMKRKFGISHYYPEAKQFITILRDPYERAVSNYFYIKKYNLDYLNASEVFKFKSVESYFMNIRFNLLDYLPAQVTKDNYKEIIEKYFIAIGITEYMDKSMKQIAHKLGFYYRSNLLANTNATVRDEEVSSDLRDKFIENHQFEYELYNYCLKRFLQQGEPLNSSLGIVIKYYNAKIYTRIKHKFLRTISVLTNK